jgi:hypothetical protein
MPESPTGRLRAALEGKPVGVVRKVGGRAGAALDFIELRYWTDDIENHGGEGGDRSFDFRLQRDEFIVAVMQEERPNYLGNALVLYTSHSQILSLEGSDAHRRNRFVAPYDSQIVGLQFEGGTLTGIHMQQVPSDGEVGAVQCIGGRVGYAVDSVSVTLRNGVARSYGTDNGDAVEPYFLKPQEYIVVVEQGRRGAFVGSAVVFYTSEGSVFELRGIQPYQANRFSVPAGRQVNGLEFEGSRLVRVRTCPLSGDMESSQTHSVVA